MNDNSKLIETVFLMAKTSSAAVEPTKSFETDSVKSDTDDTSGQFDERFADMPKQMELLDSLFTDKEAVEKLPVTQQYGKLNNIMNLRDKKGRTPLYMAIAMNNKEAAETLLNLGASPHIEDAFG